MRFREKITNYINSGYPVLLIQTSEEQRLQKELYEITKTNGGETQFWSWTITGGWACANKGVTEYPDINTPPDALNAILTTPGSPSKMADDSLMVINGFDAFLVNPEIIQLVKDFVGFCKATGRTVAFVSDSNRIPPPLISHITMVDYDLPTNSELGEVLTSVISNTEGAKKPSKEIHNQAIESALGMTEFEAENAFALSLIESSGKIVPEIIRREKAQVIKKSGLLEYYEPKSTMVDIGGLGLLKEWAGRTGKAFTHSVEAKKFGLPALNGIINVGVSGCGKSLFAKAIAKEWSLSLLRFDVSKLFGSHVGESEGNTRATLKLAEAMSPCILWIDEVEKALAGAASSGVTDGGTTARVLGILLTWMQEKEKPVFVVATANDVTGLRPELLGRFDEIFAIDLPNEQERMEIVKIHIVKRNRKPKNFDLNKIVDASNKFSGREIEQGIISGMYEAFADDKELETKHILKALKDTRPLSKTMPGQIQKIQTWSKKHARPATAQITQHSEPKKEPSRKIMIDKNTPGGQA